MTSWAPSGIISAYLTSISQHVDAELAKGRFGQTSFRIAPPALLSFHDRNISPDAFYHPNVFVWLPQILRPSLQIRCPKCNGTDISELGWVFRRIVDLNANFFVLAKEYGCGQCANKDHVFSSCDSSVLNEFPSDIQAAFPAIMLPTADGGLSRCLVNFVQACSKFDLSLEVAHSIIVDMHLARYIERKAAFEASAAQAIQNDITESSSEDGSLMISEPKFFSSFDDAKGYGGFVPPSAMLRMFFHGKDSIRPDAALWTGSVVVTATEIMPPSIVPAISIEKKPLTTPNNTSPDTGSSEPKRKRRPRRCQNRIMVDGEFVICGLLDCPGRGGQKFCKNFSGLRSQDNELKSDVPPNHEGEDLSKLSALATLVRPARENGVPVRESELVAMEALQNMI